MGKDRTEAARSRTERCLAAIADGAGEGARTFTQVYAAAARREAEAADTQGLHAGLQGAVIALKDLFDVRGEPTWAGSVVLREAPAAPADAPAVARLRRAGAVIIGKTNMTEFAYSGVGLNPHYGTPANPFERAGTRRIPGGSSSGAAIAVSDGMAELGIGTDTGGSVRIPAALCGLVGWKPTARRIPLDGVWPLAPSFDSVGVIARSVAECAAADAVLTGQPGAEAAATTGPPTGRGGPLLGLRLGRLRGYVESDLAPEVVRAYERALLRLAAAGVAVVDLPLGELERVLGEHPGLTMTASEAYQVHATRLVRSGERYDRRVRERLQSGADITPEQYAKARALRSQLQVVALEAMRGLDGWLLPTVTRIAPPIEALQSDEGYLTNNRAMLRNTSLINVLDGCAASLPCQGPGEAPVGLSVAAVGLRDAALLAVAERVEAVLNEEPR